MRFTNGLPPALGLTIAAVLLHNCANCYEDIRLADGSRTVPSWYSYRYIHQGSQSDYMLFREYILQEASGRTFLMCPQGFSIAQITYALVIGRNMSVDGDVMNKTIAFAHHLTDMEFPYNYGDREETVGYAQELCPTLKQCLHYQACVFDFSNEFCRMDPFPGYRKMLDTNVTCVRDANMNHFLELEGWSEERIREGFTSKRDLVMHIEYESRLEKGEVSFEDTAFKFSERGEGEVFRATCPGNPYARNYKGNCSEQMEDEEVSHKAWPFLARTDKKECQDIMRQTLCAFVYNADGQCLPPYTINHSVREVTFSEYSYPKRGSRPDLALLGNLEGQAKAALLPVRLGFLLLVHADIPSIMQLLEQIYRPQHFYVFHVDQRKDDVRNGLRDEIKRRYRSTNIRVLPRERSFVTSWGSFAIVRAQNEGYEELCRMGVWDFVINMSGADLMLRGVEDLALALAPYRGESFFAFHIPQFRNVDNDPKELRLLYESFVSCDGFTYNVTRTAGQPSVEDFAIRTASQWATLSRQFVEEYLDQSRHSDAWKKHYFRLQTSVIPDEAVVPTFAYHSSQREKVRWVGLYWIKGFSGTNPYNLCRHLSQADFCGQGPGAVTDRDSGDILAGVDRFFFARKFQTADPNDVTRLKALGFARGEYYILLKMRMSRLVLDTLCKMAAAQQAHAYGKIMKYTKPILVIENLYVFPKLNPSDPCCSPMFDRHFKSAQELSYILDFSFHDSNNDGSTAMRAKFDLAPQGLCYGKGHLKGLRVTTWTTEFQGRQVANPANIPIPFGIERSEVVFVELFFSTSNKTGNSKCKGQEGEGQDMIRIENIEHSEKNVTGDPFEYAVELIDPQGSLRCSKFITGKWDTENVRPDPYKERTESSAVHELKCGPLEMGEWRVEVYTMKSENPYRYQSKLLILPAKAELENYKDFQKLEFYMKKLYKFVAVALLPLQDFYGDKRGHTFSSEIRDVNLDEEATERPLSPTTTRPRCRHDELRITTQPMAALREWLLCSGGLITLVMSVQFAYYWLVVPLVRGTRAVATTRRDAAKAMTYVFLSVVGQVVLSEMYCAEDEQPGHVDL